MGREREALMGGHSAGSARVMSPHWRAPLCPGRTSQCPAEDAARLRLGLAPTISLSAET